MRVQKKQKRLFGTNGVRGIAGKDLTPELVFSIGKALGPDEKRDALPLDAIPGHPEKHSVKR